MSSELKIECLSLIKEVSSLGKINCFDLTPSEERTYTPITGTTGGILNITTRIPRYNGGITVKCDTKNELYLKISFYQMFLILSMLLTHSITVKFSF